MYSGFVLAVAAPGSRPGLGALCRVSLPLSLILFPIISSAVLSIKPINGCKNIKEKKKQWQAGGYTDQKQQPAAQHRPTDFELQPRWLLFVPLIFCETQFEVNINQYHSLIQRPQTLVQNWISTSLMQCQQKQSFTKTGLFVVLAYCITLHMWTQLTGNSVSLLVAGHTISISSHSGQRFKSFTLFCFLFSDVEEERKGVWARHGAAGKGEDRHTAAISRAQEWAEPVDGCDRDRPRPPTDSTARGGPGLHIHSLRWADSLPVYRY